MRTLTLLAGGGGALTGYSRVNGALLSEFGTAGGLVIDPATAAFNDKPTLDTGSGNAALKLPAGDVVASYTIVAVASFTSETLTGATNYMFLGTIDTGTDTWELVWRVRGNGLTGTTGLIFTPSYPVEATPTEVIAIAEMPAADVAGVFVVQWNDTTKTFKQCLDSTTVLATQTIAGASTNVDADNYYGFLDADAPVSAGTRGNIADVYIFSAPLLDDAYSALQLAQLISALQTHYGIAV